MFEVKTIDSVTNLLNLNMGALKKGLFKTKHAKTTLFNLSIFILFS